MRYLLTSLFTFTVAIALSGCGTAHHEDAAHAHEHGGEKTPSQGAHPTTGPHHGDLIELGNEEYHAEFVHDDASHTITLFILDSSAKQAVPIDAQSLLLNVAVNGSPTQVALPAAPQADDPAGKSSCFKLVDQKLCETLDHPSVSCRVNIAVADRHYTANLNHHHDHDEQHR